jgi:hypothetical protein
MPQNLHLTRQDKGIDGNGLRQLEAKAEPSQCQAADTEQADYDRSFVASDGRGHRHVRVRSEAGW